MHSNNFCLVKISLASEILLSNIGIATINIKIKKKFNDWKTNNYTNNLLEQTSFLW